LYCDPEKDESRFEFISPVPDEGDTAGALKWCGDLHRQYFRAKICKVPEDSIVVSTERLRAYAARFSSLDLFDMFIDSSEEFQCPGFPLKLIQPALGFENIRLQIELEEMKKLTNLIRESIRESQLPKGE
jgi:hypothetical protein